MYFSVAVCNCVRGTGSCAKKASKGKCPSGYSEEDVQGKEGRCSGRYWKKPGIMSAPRRETV